MFNPPTKRRRLHVAVMGVLLTAATSGCSVVGAMTADSATSAAGTTSPASPGSAVAEPLIQAGACLDGTGSLAASYATQFQAQLAVAVGDWAAAPPANPADGVAGQPGLHLVVRSVTTYSYSTDPIVNPSVNDTVPAVAPIAPQPSPTDPNYNDDDRAWLDNKPNWQRQASAAAAKADHVAAEVRAYRVVRGTNSAIWSCLSGAANQLGSMPGNSMRLVEMSDFLNNEPVVGLSLASAKVLLVTVCSADVSTTCPQRFDAARSLLLKHGASDVEEIAADALTPQVLVQFWRS